MVYSLRRQLFVHLQRLSLSFHNRARSGDLLIKVTDDTNALKDVFVESALAVVGYLLTFFGMFAVMFALNWNLSLIVLASVPVPLYTSSYLYRNIQTSATSPPR